MNESGSLLALLEAGGTVMWILAGLSVFALAIILNKFWDFWRAGIWRRREVNRALSEWQAGRDAAALKPLEHAHDPVADVLRVALAGRMDEDVDDTVVREEVARRGAAWLESLRGGLRPLELIGTLAPLLGLLGTVIGMIDAFRELESAGSQVDPSVLSGGIWVALLTTAAGLSVAIPAVAMHTLLERQLEGLHHRMQDAATRVFSRSVGRIAADTASTGDDSATNARTESAPARLAEAAGAD
jgi:biopolymer transport protein ExbB